MDNFIPVKRQLYTSSRNGGSLLWIDDIWKGILSMRGNQVNTHTDVHFCKCKLDVREHYSHELVIGGIFQGVWSHCQRHLWEPAQEGTLEREQEHAAQGRAVCEQLVPSVVDTLVLALKGTLGTGTPPSRSHHQSTIPEVQQSWLAVNEK